VAASVIALVPVRAGATASPPRCRQLVVASTTVEGADGVGSVTILLANVGGRCELQGYPTVQFFESRFTHLIGHDIHRATMVFAAPAPNRVTLARGSVASIGVSWSNDPKVHQTCSRTQWANVVLPSAGRLNFQPSLNAVPCGNDIWVTPIEAGARPKLSWNAPPS
jgi:hypothetical protein